MRAKQTITYLVLHKMLSYLSNRYMTEKKEDMINAKKSFIAFRIQHRAKKRMIRMGSSLD
jgi:hypothetical protein